MDTMNCPWCEMEYVDFDRDIEAAHLAACRVFQTLPVAVTYDGRTFVQHPFYDHILVERVRVN